jgi:hypothetical protein
MSQNFGGLKYKFFYPTGVLAVMYLCLSHPSSTQAQSLRPVCVGIPSSTVLKQQPTCCQNRRNESCPKWEQLLPAVQSQPKVTPPNPKSSKPFMRAEKRPKVFDPNKSRSENAAKDAVIQLGIDTVWSLIEGRSGVFKTDKKSKQSKSGKQRKPNFFQRAQREYNHLFSPHPLGKDKTIEPRLDIGLDLNNDVTLDSMKAGVKIKF